MGSHPLNLAVRFLLEIAALVGAGLYGWRFDPPQRFILAALLPLLMAAAWGIFAVQGDPSRSGRAPVPVPGWLRLMIELAVLGFGVWAVAQSGYQTVAAVMGLVVIIHYALSYDRLKWLLSR